VRLVKLLLALAVGLVLLAGAWVASSIAALLGSPRALALTAALAPSLLPIAWELWRPARAAYARRLGVGGRWLLRALGLDVALLAAVFAWAPDTALRALRTRGDWALDGRTDALAEHARRGLLGIAERTARLYDRGRTNPYDALVDRTVIATPAPARRGVMPRRATRTSTAAPTRTSTPARDALATGDGGRVARERVIDRGNGAPLELVIDGSGDADVRGVERLQARPAHAWPLARELHPAISRLSRLTEDVRTIDALGAHLAAVEPDAILRAKAVHDWIAEHVAYDVEALAARVFPPQDAATIFTRRVALCAGYANLFAALGRAAGLDVAIVTGVARVAGRPLEAEGHAWNAVQVDGVWSLVDVTWDAGTVADGVFTKRYSTAYLLAPPDVVGVTHLPAEPEWQLVDAPVSAGEFYRRPLLQPSFFAHGLTLVSPDRAQLDVADVVRVVVEAPARVFLLARTAPRDAAGDATQTECAVARDGATTRIECALPTRGPHRWRLFGAPVEHGTYELLGELEVNRT
jgi:transglutaminase-like putative cysteine protease